jgi:hypothetical protein
MFFFWCSTVFVHSCNQHFILTDIQIWGYSACMYSELCIACAQIFFLITNGLCLWDDNKQVLLAQTYLHAEKKWLKLTFMLKKTYGTAEGKLTFMFIYRCAYGSKTGEQPFYLWNAIYTHTCSLKPLLHTQKKGKLSDVLFSNFDVCCSGPLLSFTYE